MSGNVERYERAMNQGHNAAWDQMWDRAAQFYRQALAEIPNDPKAMTSLALALYETKQFAEALTCYQRAAEQSPEDPIPLEKVAELLERTGRADQAVEAFWSQRELYLEKPGCEQRH
jgi:tetratricopeptide (TPR) repeat protein